MVRHLFVNILCHNHNENIDDTFCRINIIEGIRISMSLEIGGFNMTIIKVSEDKYINLDRMTYVEPARSGKLIVHFDVGGGDMAGPDCCVKLDHDEAVKLRKWLDSKI